MRAAAPITAVSAFILGVACGSAKPRPEKGGANANETVTVALADAVKLIRARRLDDAERRLAGVRQVAFEDANLLEKLDYYIATVLAYRGDLNRAQRLINLHAKNAVSRNDTDSEAWMYSCAAWLRWAAGDVLGAIAENERIGKAIGAESEIDAMDRRTLILAHMWDRAFFLIDNAYAVDGADRAAALKKANDARDEFEALARDPDQHEAVALLAAYFAWRQGDTKAAARAAEGLSHELTDDARGLYVLIVVREGTGDATGAAAARSRLATTVTLLTPLLERALSTRVSAPSSSGSSSSGGSAPARQATASRRRYAWSRRACW